MENAAAAVIGDEFLHDDARDLHAKLAEHVHEEVVRERTLARDAGDPRGDAVRLVGSDPDGEEPVAVLRLKQHDVLAGKHVHADRLDGTWHEHRVRLTPSDARPACGGALSEQWKEQDAGDESEYVCEVRD